jgi:hypothetical protein
MNLKTAAEILALNTAGQREYAKQIDVKRTANDTKKTLCVKLLDRTLELEQKQEQAQTAAPVQAPKAGRRWRTAKAICNVCNKRRAGNDSGIQDMCQLCADEGGWENTHSDNNHEGIRAKVAKGEQLDESEAVELDSEWMKDCWICFPEKNRAQRPQREGHSKLGMAVVAKGNKIDVVVEALRKAGAIVATDTDAKTGYTGLVASLETAIGTYKIECGWFGRAFHYPAASFNGKKFRNVSELFRLLDLKAE